MLTTTNKGLENNCKVKVWGKSCGQLLIIFGKIKHTKRQLCVGLIDSLEN